MCELDGGFPASNLHVLRVFQGLNGAGSHMSRTAAGRIPQGSCAGLGPVRVRIQVKIQTWFTPKPVNRHAPDPILGTAAAHMWTQPEMEILDFFLWEEILEARLLDLCSDLWKGIISQY